MKAFIPYCLIGLAGICQLKAASINLGIGIHQSGNAEFGLKNEAGVLLTRGVGNVVGDGAVLQIGYYTQATLLDPFQGHWIPITGQGTPYPTSVGDSGYPDGWTKSVNFLVAGTLGFVEPLAGTPLALRFYDSTTLVASAYFNAVAATDGTFTWAAPSDPMTFIGITLPKNRIVWQDGPDSAYRTTIAIPEPSSGIILTFTAGLFATRRRRSKSID